ncbi:DNA starvation/stationary phase protection protein [Gryllotalpicola kribbensis]|jgi:starvation-inducible DNA-binding protein|uniref:DNA starvation/stationary phase protection protein n=1 Tax=Gryllotalpicola kribbensis TaxID=993084 RepID=A0ABP8AUM7_9MICO
MNDTIGNARRGEDAAPFQGSERLTASLQQCLTDLLELQLQTKQAHWNVVGSGFRSLHLQLDEVADSARDLADAVAERLRAVGSVADGRSDSLVRNTTLPAFPVGEMTVSDTERLILGRLRSVAEVVRSITLTVDSEDAPSGDVLNGAVATLEKHAWMLASEQRRRSTWPVDGS